MALVLVALNVKPCFCYFFAEIPAWPFFTHYDRSDGQLSSLTVNEIPGKEVKWPLRQKRQQQQLRNKPSLLFRRKKINRNRTFFDLIIRFICPKKKFGGSDEWMGRPNLCPALKEYSFECSEEKKIKSSFELIKKTTQVETNLPKKTQKTKKKSKFWFRKNEYFEWDPKN